MDGVGVLELQLQVSCFKRKKNFPNGYSWFPLPFSSKRSSKDTRVGNRDFESKKFSALRVSRGKGSNGKYQNTGNTLEAKRMEVERANGKVFRNPRVAFFKVSER